MDAAHKLLLKASLLPALAVLLAAPAFAQTLQVSTTDITLPNGGVPSTTVTVTSSNGTPIPFTVAKTTGDTTFYDATADTGTTPDPVLVKLLCSCFNARDGAFTITNANNPADVVTINVHYVLGGGGGAGIITASPNPLSVGLVSGTTGSASVTLSTTSSTAIGFTLATTTGAFISSYNASASQVSAGSPATLTVNLSAAGLSDGFYQGIITITPTGGTNTILNVQLTVGTGSGTALQFTSGISTFNLAYPNGTQLASTAVTSGTGVTAFDAIVTNGPWLLINGAAGQLSGLPINSSIQLSLGGNIATLTTGSYAATVTVRNSNNFNEQAYLTVNLTVNQGTLANLIISQPNVTFSVPAGTTSTSTQTISLSSNQTALITGFNFSNNGWLSAFITNSNFSLPTSITVTVSPSGLPANTYTGSLTVSFAGGVDGTQTIPVTLVVGSSTGTINGIAPTALTFSYQTGSNTFIPQQSVSVSGTGPITVNAPVLNNTSGSVQWISAAASSGSAPGLVTIRVFPEALPVGQYTGTVPVVTASGTTNIAVTLNVVAAVVLYSNPATIPVSSSTSTQITIFAGDGSNVPFTASSSAAWVALSAASSSTTPAGIQVTINTAGLANGVNTANITITAPTAGNTPLIVPVVADVSGSTAVGVSLSQTSMSFNATAAGAVTAAQTLSVTAATTTSFTVTTSIQSGGTNWLIVTPTGGLNTNQNLSVSVNPAGLSAGTFSGTISVTANGSVQNVSVTVVVASGVVNSITPSPSSLAFTPAGSVSQSKGIQVTSLISSAVSFTVTTSTTSGGSWLSTSISNGTTTASLNVIANPAGLSAGTYQGTVTLTPGLGIAVNVPVTMTITSTVTATSASGTTLAFSYRAGDANPASQSITVDGTFGASFTAVTSSTGNWLAVSQSTGVVPATLLVTVNPASLNPGTYNGSIVVAGAAGAGGSTSFSVILTVTAPLPTINTGGVTNAASYLAGSLSPGEIFTIFGTAIGPPTAVGLTLDSNGRVLTTLGGVQVLINGFLAPLVVVSDKQISAVVPYELAPFVSATVQVRYLGQSSNGVTVSVAATAPGIFTALQTGKGPGAIYDANQNAANLPGSPSPRGNTVVLYVTGEGTTSPAVTGRVTPGTLPYTLPLLVPTVLIDGIPARVDFYGEAPNFTAGVMQINAVIPANAGTGDRPLVVRINGVDSQPGVTISIR